jgi:putative transposase
MSRGFVYLCAVVDWFSWRVLSWRLSITMEAAFCIEAVEEALARCTPPVKAADMISRAIFYRLYTR